MKPEASEQPSLLATDAPNLWCWISASLRTHPVPWVLERLQSAPPPIESLPPTHRLVRLHAVAAVAQSCGHVRVAYDAIARAQAGATNTDGRLHPALGFIKSKLDFQLGQTTGPEFDLQRALRAAKARPDRVNLSLLWRASLVSCASDSMWRAAFDAHHELSDKPGHERGNGCFVCAHLLLLAQQPHPAIARFNMAAENFAANPPEASPYFPPTLKFAHLLSGMAAAHHALGNASRAMVYLCVSRELFDITRAIPRLGAGMEPFMATTPVIWPFGFHYMTCSSASKYRAISDEPLLRYAHGVAMEVLPSLLSSDITQIGRAIHNDELVPAGKSAPAHAADLELASMVLHPPVIRSLMMQQIRPFIVHGRDELLREQLKNFLQNRLHTQEPVVLLERPDTGRTIIEKFEEEGGQCNVAFVLLTPDDTSIDAETARSSVRARQNVIFELGYFAGKFGRKTGRVILLYRGPLELPSDLTGVLYVDVSSGLNSAKDQIRAELERLFDYAP